MYHYDNDGCNVQIPSITARFAKSFWYQNFNRVPAVLTARPMVNSLRQNLMAKGHQVAEPAKFANGARAALVLLLLINLFNYIDRYILAANAGPIMDTFFGAGKELPPAEGPFSVLGLVHWVRKNFGFEPRMAVTAILATAFMVFYMVTAPMFGRLAERRSRWMLIGFAVIIWSLATGLSGLAATFGLLLMSRCLVGIGEGAYGPVAPALISDYFPSQKRGRVLSWFYAAIPVGSALGYVIGSLIQKSDIGAWGEKHFGIWGESWRWAFYAVTIPGMLLGLWACLKADPPRGQADAVAAWQPRRADWRNYTLFWRIRSYVFCTFGMTAMTFAMGGIGFWMPYYLEKLPNAPAQATAIFGLVTVAAGLSATLLGGWAGDRLRARFPSSYFMVSAISMLVGFPVFLMALHSGYPWVWVLIFMACFCLFFSTGPTNAILANVTHPATRAEGFALNIFFIHIFGDVISPVIIGMLSDMFSIRVGFLAVGFMFLASGIFWLFGMPHLARDMELASTRIRTDVES